MTFLGLIAIWLVSSFNWRYILVAGQLAKIPFAALLKVDVYAVVTTLFVYVVVAELVQID